jgi:hypothetical protein
VAAEKIYPGETNEKETIPIIQAQKNKSATVANPKRNSIIDMHLVLVSAVCASF